jgi:hypothetical protein
MKDEPNVTPTSSPNQFLRLPGLFRRWEIEQVLEPGADFHLEEAGTASDGTPLYAVFRRQPCEFGTTKDASPSLTEKRGTP